MRKKIKDIAIILVITVLILTGIEVVLQITLPSKPSKKAQTSQEDIKYQKHPIYIYTLKPNIEGRLIRHYQDGGDTIIWKTNSHGFRGKELKKAPQKRVMVYGDSNIQAVFSKEENTFCYKLEENLINYYKEDIEVINAGTIAYGPDQSLLKMKEQIPLYKPDIVVFHFFAANDFGDIIRNNLFRLDKNNQLNYKNNYKGDYLTMPEKQKNSKSLLENLRIYRVAKKINKAIFKKNKKKRNEFSKLIKRCSKEYNDYINNQTKRLNRARLFWDHYDMIMATSPNSESSKLKKKLLQAIFTEASDYAFSKNIQFVVLIQPAMEDICRNNTNFNYETLKQNFPAYKPSNLSFIADSICTKNNIKSINLYNDFVRNMPESLYFSKDPGSHWNDLGQKLASDIVANYIIGGNLIQFKKD